MPAQLQGLTRQRLQGTKAERSKRQPFEDSIKRPYFHVKPLDALQLSTWSRYLDFMDQKGDAGAAVRLYERCVVPCASYPGKRCSCVVISDGCSGLVPCLLPGRVLHLRMLAAGG